MGAVGSESLSHPATIEPINIYAKVDLPLSLPPSPSAPLGITTYGRLGQEVELMWEKLIIIMIIMDEMALRRRTTIR